MFAPPLRYATSTYDGPSPALSLPIDPRTNIALHHCGDLRSAALPELVGVNEIMNPRLKGTMPELYGVSGCSLWTVGKGSAGLWNPDESIKVVAIQTGYVPGKLIVGTRWSVLLQLLLMTEEGLQPVIHAAMEKQGVVFQTETPGQ